jgi:hypothetical protein
MLNENASNLKAHLQSLHQNLAETGELDEEAQELLRQLDRDIKQLLEKREGEVAVDTYGLAERTQELSARFAVEHPRLEPALRELGNILASMGI